VVVPQIAVLGIFFQQTINDAGLQVMGLFLAIIGLTMFLDGLRVAVMVSFVPDWVCLSGVDWYRVALASLPTRLDTGVMSVCGGEAFID